MTPLFNKLQYKNTAAIGVFDAPASFQAELQLMAVEAAIITRPSACTEGSFLMAFATTQQELDYWSDTLVSKLANDGVLWMCYPKGTSKHYTCEFNRDTGWTVLTQLGFEPVRAVSIDADWSALRFRKPAHIKQMTRSFARTAEGNKRIRKQ